MELISIKNIFSITIIVLLLTAIFCSGCTSPSETTEKIDSQGISDAANETDESSLDQRDNEYSPNNDYSIEERFTLPPLQPVDIGTSLTDTRIFSTKFENREYDIEIEVNRSVYLGAQNVDKEWPKGKTWYDEEFVVEYYSAFIEDPEIDRFLDEFLKPFERIKRTDNLNDEEFLEIMITFVQQIPYDRYAPEYPRFPIEVIYDETGDCDEKSLLLLGMLSHEGYDVAFIIFPDIHHATAGIRINPSGNPSFRVFESPDKAKYFYIETTIPTYIGLYSEEFEQAEAVVIPIGEGDKRFDRVNYICYITDSYTKIENRLVFMENTMSEWKSEITSLEWKLQYESYDSLEEWNDDYIKYNRLIQDYNSYAEKYNKYLEIYKYINEHPYDIAGVYRRIENSKVMEIKI